MSVLARRVLQEPWGWSKGSPGVEVGMSGQRFTNPHSLDRTLGSHGWRSYAVLFHIADVRTGVPTSQDGLVPTFCTECVLLCNVSGKRFGTQLVCRYYVQGCSRYSNCNPACCVDIIASGLKCPFTFGIEMVGTNYNRKKNAPAWREVCDFKFNDIIGADDRRITVKIYEVARRQRSRALQRTGTLGEDPRE